ncbi:NAD-dependent epimerase/dehydratase family protein [Pedobacter duraquae]|uniref:Nucleoside-diphosphate-sugar epimerase n=1 Tax=Pedobacter duraquae TaxID=425511 RepID=A0A4R6IJ08_9SPHI|nr:NAD-dependent epimerase/dehydratase family protein [Pedobacter duraquae]TDO21980.1 nucleoside-diphosphate-sugar epimerase [Pedobacter duraquae]
MKVGITGSSGFVGLNIESYLRKFDFDISRLNREALGSPKIDLRHLDIIIHLAGKAHDLSKSPDPTEYYTVNYELTKRLYDSFLMSKATVFIFMSSVKAVADTVTDILTEDAIPIPSTDYGKSKLMAERYIEKQKLPEGKHYYILRPCMIHGPGNKGNLNLLYKFVGRKVPYPLAKFKNLRSYVTVENLCFIVLHLIMKNNVASGIYNIADDRPLSTNEIVSILGKSMSIEPKFLHVPVYLIDLVAKLGDFFNLSINSEKLKKLTENYLVDNSKIKNAIELNLPISSYDGLLKSAASFADDKAG